MDLPHLLDLAAADFLAWPHRNLIGEHWQDATGSSMMEVVDPETGAVISHLARSASADVDLVVIAVHYEEQGPWGRLAASDRSHPVNELAAGIQDARDQLTLLEALDTGRPVFECRLVNIPGSVNMLEPAFPIGGHEQSGWSRAAGFPAIEPYAELKAVVAKP